MKKLKHILIFLLLVTATLMINGGTRTKDCTVRSAPIESIKKIAFDGFPDMISFTNYINQ